MDVNDIKYLLHEIILHDIQKYHPKLNKQESEYIESIELTLRFNDDSGDLIIKQPTIMPHINLRPLVMHVITSSSKHYEETLEIEGFDISGRRRLAYMSKLSRIADILVKYNWEKKIPKEEKKKEVKTIGLTTDGTIPTTARSSPVLCPKCGICMMDDPNGSYCTKCGHRTDGGMKHGQ